MGYAQNRLVSAIYEMALGRSNWDYIVDILSGFFPGAVIMVSADDMGGNANLAVSQRGLTREAADAYVGTYVERDPWRAEQANAAIHQVFHDDQLVPRDTARASDFYREWVVPNPALGASTGVVVLREGGRQLSITIHYPVAREAEYREPAAQVLAEAAPHFGRAFEIAGMSRFPAGEDYLDRVVDDLPFCVFFVDRDLRVRYANLQAEALRRQKNGPFASSDGVLRTADASADASLRQLVGKIVGSARMPASVLQVPSRDGEHRHFVIARPAHRASHSYALHDAILDPGPLVMLVVHASQEIASLPTELLWRAFSLTESEARIAEALLAGATLADFAKSHEVSKQTVRNQLVGLMRKTGTRRQSELVSLLTRLSLTCL